jgi:hypothetical protein
MGRIEDWMVAEEGLTVFLGQDEAKSVPRFAKTKAPKTGKKNPRPPKRGCK